MNFFKADKSTQQRADIKIYIEPIKGVLASETVRFTGGLHFYKNGTLYREVIIGLEVQFDLGRRGCAGAN
ncbi:hypothetical protein CCUS01_09300 [Colletotrichum cuscutae]|uniref:Uncharacterized protein n=1 Tax=Colletotrichum cuscutae TaxID=1209917 RepID=A0AAI9UHH0_9PEZI|nr:hypothetical protein CCUS01_09300 [Colletotrichum cuscutae]